MKVNFNLLNPNVYNKTQNNILKTLFERKIRIFPKDYDYIKLLGNNIGLKENELFKLYPIIGPEQLKNILQKADRQNYYAGKNIPHGDITKSEKHNIPEEFKLNLHMHTINSDGKMSVESLLNQSSYFADTKKSIPDMPNFVIAITDHDTFEGSKEAAKLIAKNPFKYKNLGVILGAELSAIYRDAKYLNKPFEYEMIAYSINPFDRQLGEYLSDTLNQRINVAKNIVNTAKQLYPQYNFSYEEACTKTINAKKGINGFLYTLTDYFRDKIKSMGGKDDLKYLCDNYQPENYTKRPLLFNEAEDIFANMR